MSAERSSEPDVAGIVDGVPAALTLLGIVYYWLVTERILVLIGADPLSPRDMDWGPASLFLVLPLVLVCGGGCALMSQESRFRRRHRVTLLVVGLAGILHFLLPFWRWAQ